MSNTITQTTTTMEPVKPALSKTFLSQFKNEKELTDFFTDLYKRAINQMLEGEMDACSLIAPDHLRWQSAPLGPIVLHVGY